MDILYLSFFHVCRPFHKRKDLPSVDDTVANASRMEGYFNLYWEESSGKMYWEIDKLDTEFLYQISMGSGLGSNPVGIDRGQLRGTYVLAAKRVGPRILLVQPNYRYRASSDNISGETGGRGCLCAFGALGVRYRGSRRRQCVGRCD